MRRKPNAREREQTREARERGQTESRLHKALERLALRIAHQEDEAGAARLRRIAAARRAAAPLLAWAEQELDAWVRQWKDRAEHVLSDDVPDARRVGEMMARGLELAHRDAQNPEGAGPREGAGAEEERRAAHAAEGLMALCTSDGMVRWRRTEVCEEAVEQAMWLRWGPAYRLVRGRLSVEHKASRLRGWRGRWTRWSLPCAIPAAALDGIKAGGGGHAAAKSFIDLPRAVRAMAAGTASVDALTWNASGTTRAGRRIAKALGAARTCTGTTPRAHVVDALLHAQAQGRKGTAAALWWTRAIPEAERLHRIEAVLVRAGEHEPRQCAAWSALAPLAETLSACEAGVLEPGWEEDAKAVAAVRKASRTGAAQPPEDVAQAVMGAYRHPGTTELAWWRDLLVKGLASTPRPHDAATLSGRNRLAALLAVESAMVENAKGRLVWTWHVRKGGRGRRATYVPALTITGPCWAERLTPSAAGQDWGKKYEESWEKERRTKGATARERWLAVHHVLEVYESHVAEMLVTGGPAGPGPRKVQGMRAGADPGPNAARGPAGGRAKWWKARFRERVAEEVEAADEATREGRAYAPWVADPDGWPDGIGFTREEH